MKVYTILRQKLNILKIKSKGSRFKRGSESFLFKKQVALDLLLNPVYLAHSSTMLPKT